VDEDFARLSLDRMLLADSLLVRGSPRQILQEAHRRLDIALKSLAKGDTVATRIVIDDILGLMVALSDANDPAIARGRDDMIKRLSTLIHSLQSEHRMGIVLKGEIPRVINDRVEKQLKWYKQKNPEGLRVSYARSGRYGAMVRRELAIRGLPQELQWLPIVESAYHPLAYSWANAAGLWQFIPETGKRYGLTQTSWVDDRMDPYKATSAAVAYLSDLYDMFGDWLLALAAYNCGEERVLRAINRYGTQDFWALKLPRETADYVPRFLAAITILAHPEQYGLTLPDPLPPYVFEEARLEKSIALADAARVLGISHDQLKAMNTGIRNGVTPPGGYDLRVPLGTSSILLARLADIPEGNHTPQPEGRSYKVRRGDTLARIASRFGTSVTRLKQLNKLRGTLIRVGQTLHVPGKGYDDTAVASAETRKPASSSSSEKTAQASGGHVSYKVRRGDTLFSIAQKHGTTVDALIRANRLRSARIQVNQVLALSGEAPETVVQAPAVKASLNPEPGSTTTVSYKVRRGDTLGAIADRFNVSLSVLRKANPRVKPTRLMVGQTIVIPGRKAAVAVVASLPSAGKDTSSVTASTASAAPVASASTSLSPGVHVVQQGESIWSIARQYGLSVVEVLRLNRMKRGAVILPGQILKLATGSAQPLGHMPSVSTQGLTVPAR
jgi:membrane-bound lytic murein transglycosylase D